MGVTVTDQNEVTIIGLSGKIMGGPEAGQVNETINALIDEGKNKIVMDLKEVEWMNSSGLGILIGTITTLKNNNGRLSLIHVSDRIQHLLKITKLSNVFTIHSDLETALKDFA